MPSFFSSKLKERGFFSYQPTSRASNRVERKKEVSLFSKKYNRARNFTENDTERTDRRRFDLIGQWYSRSMPNTVGTVLDEYYCCLW